MTHEDLDLTESQLALLKQVGEKGSVSIEEFADLIPELRELISAGMLRLKIACYVWGTDYSVTLEDTPHLAKEISILPKRPSHETITQE